MYCYLIVLRSHVYLVAFIGTVTTALQAATNRLYLVGRRFDHGPRGCKCRIWMQIILSILLCTRSCVVINRHSLMTVRLFEWEHIEYAQMYVLLTLSCRCIHCVPGDCGTTRISIQTFALMTTFWLRDARNLWSSIHFL
jgi:hypothetical protein